jgi:AcrR family transcriptional regulator
MKPTGREEVRQAVIEAAIRLFAERGPASVSIRELAAEAGVNHGLVHRHFGTKEELLTVVMNHLVSRFERAAGPPDDDETPTTLGPKLFAAARSQRAYWRILVRAILEGRDPAELQGGFPIVQRLLAAARRDPATASAPESFVAGTVAMGLGLVVFEPFLRAAMGLDATQWRAIQRELSETELTG